MPSVRRVDPALVERLWRQVRADRWSLSVDAFGDALEASAARTSGEGDDAAAIERGLERLHLEDLALAAACAAGHESAWNHFITTHRAALHRAADAIDRTGRARELADALHGELFGLSARGEPRPSLFRYFHGRSSLSTWLRAILAQRHVDRMRDTRRLVELPADVELAGASGSVEAPAEHAQATAAVRAALGAAIAALAPRDRLRLRLYYVQTLTLAAIGRLTHEHEATVSRQLARTRREVRALMERDLQKRQGLDPEAAASSVRQVIDDPGTLDVASVLRAGPESSQRKIGATDRSKS